MSQKTARTALAFAAASPLPQNACARYAHHVHANVRVHAQSVQFGFEERFMKGGRFTPLMQAHM